MRGGAGGAGRPRFTELAVSPLAYGIPDFAAGALNETGQRDAVRREIEATIRRFEPRLARVGVTLLDEPNALSATLRLRIDGTAARRTRRPSRSPSTPSSKPPPPRSGCGRSTMSDALLPYYDRELNAHPPAGRRVRRRPPEDRRPPAAVRRCGGRPACRPPAGGRGVPAARVHHRLDDEFPELTDALLGVLYPHYLAPVPSAAIVAVRVHGRPHSARRGRRPGSTLDTEPVRGETCRFRTTRPVTLWPIEIESVRLSGLPLAAPANTAAAGAVAVLRIALKCANPQGSFAALGIDRLRLFLRGPANATLPLYELLCGHTLAVAFADGPTTSPPPVVGPRRAGPGRVRRRRGAAALARPQLRRLPPADRVFRLPGEVPVRRSRAAWTPAA